MNSSPILPVFFALAVFLMAFPFPLEQRFPIKLRHIFYNKLMEKKLNSYKLCPKVMWISSINGCYYFNPRLSAIISNPPFISNGNVLENNQNILLFNREH